MVDKEVELAIDLVSHLTARHNVGDRFLLVDDFKAPSCLLEFHNVRNHPIRFLCARLLVQPEDLAEETCLALLLSDRFVIVVDLCLIDAQYPLLLEAH